MRKQEKSFFQKFFRRKKTASPISSDVPRNEYYETASARLGIVQVILYLTLFAYVILSFFANTELITYRNFYYFFKDLNASFDAVDLFNTDSVSYRTSDEQSFTLYRQGLAVAGNTGVTVFSATGRQCLSVSVDYQNPIAVGSGKYLLVYELGGVQYSLYNSNAQLYSGECDYPISAAAVSDSGMYALVTASKEYTSTVSLYSSQFSLLNRYNKNGYVMDVAIDAKGETVAVLTTSSVNGVFSTALLLAEPGKKEAIAEPIVSDSLGLRCCFTDSGKIAVLYSDGISFLSKRGKTEASLDFEGQQPQLYDVGADGAVVSLKKNTISEKNIVIVFDKNGKIVYNDVITERIGQLSRSEDSLYWTTDTGVSRLNLRNGSVWFHECVTDRRVLLAVSEEEALICSPQKAIYLKFDS